MPAPACKVLAIARMRLAGSLFTNNSGGPNVGGPFRNALFLAEWAFIPLRVRPRGSMGLGLPWERNLGRGWEARRDEK